MDGGGGKGEGMKQSEPEIQARLASSPSVLSAGLPACLSVRLALLACLFVSLLSCGEVLRMRTSRSALSKL